MLHKDEALDRLAAIGNVAQFVAFRPVEGGKLRQSTSRILGMAPNAVFDTVEVAVETLLATSADGAVNIRSYMPSDPRSREFVYGIRTAVEALGHLRRLAGEGLHLILNETIDVADGGVSGVAQHGMIEFAPDDTPRAVEKPGTATLSRAIGLDLLGKVYGVAPELPDDDGVRVEFSLHPAPRGWRGTHTLLWEIEDVDGPSIDVSPRWPNRFSRHLGDKVFGLLVADALGEAVPATTVIARRVAPFRFGSATGRDQVWTRTAPREPEPGLFTTAKGWLDPFALLAAEDRDGRIASVLAQAGVRPEWSGASLTNESGETLFEGVRGEGERLMLGEEAPVPLPAAILRDVSAMHARLVVHLGPVRTEWVHDGTTAWVVQLHVGSTESNQAAVVAGDAETWVDFDVVDGLPALRGLLATVPAGAGVILHGEFGLTSHIADVLRRWGGPSRMRPLR